MKFFIVLLMTISLFSSYAFAHGEDKYGPNKGFIKMPGSFHTELVPQKDGSFHVFLLDLQNKNPAIKDSAVELRFSHMADSSNFKCTPVENHFNCINDKKTHSLKEGQLFITAKRLSNEAKEIAYDLPLKLKNEHSGH